MSLAQLDQHLGGRVDNSHLVQDRGAVVGDGHLTLRVLDHLVHAPERIVHRGVCWLQTLVDCIGYSIVLAVFPNAPRSQASPDSFCKSFGRLDVALPDLFGLRVLGFHQPGASLARSLLCCSRISHPAVSAKEVDVK